MACDVRPAAISRWPRHEMAGCFACNQATVHWSGGCCRHWSCRHRREQSVRASADGYIRCYNHFDSPAWERLLEGVPAGGPVVAEEDCYVAVPGKGLHAFVAAPRDEPGGVLSWISAKADGQIIAHDGRTLLLHDAEDDVLRVVRRKDGRMTAEVPAGATGSSSRTVGGFRWKVWCG